MTPEIIAPDTVAVGQDVHLHGMTEDATHWYWDFSNGETSDHTAPVTSYETAGSHDIHIHLINMNIHETCDAAHTHSIFVDESLTNTEEPAFLDFAVFPNPTSEKLNIQGLESLVGDYQMRLLSPLGQTLKLDPLDTEISLAAFPAGMYVLEILDNQKVIGRKRVIKN